MNTIQSSTAVRFRSLTLAVTLLAFAVRALPAAAAEAKVNTASAEQLSLPLRVGHVVAQRILEYREQIGKFETIEDLMLVRGIGEKTLELIAPHATLNVLAEILKKGVRLAVDDFGAGDSNLRYISALTPDIVKFDRQLVSGNPWAKSTRAVSTSGDTILTKTVRIARAAADSGDGDEAEAAPPQLARQPTSTGPGWGGVTFAAASCPSVSSADPVPRSNQVGPDPGRFDADPSAQPISAPEGAPCF